jgi:hypothetical protein
LVNDALGKIPIIKKGETKKLLHRARQTLEAEIPRVK